MAKYTFPYEQNTPNELERVVEGVVEEAFICLEGGVSWDGSGDKPQLHLSLVGDAENYQLDSRLHPRINVGTKVRLYVNLGERKRTEQQYGDAAAGRDFSFVPAQINALHILDDAGNTVFRYLSSSVFYQRKNNPFLVR